jgi:hypothetical protein
MRFDRPTADALHTYVSEAPRLTACFHVIGALGSPFHALRQIAEKWGTSSRWRLELGRHPELRRIYSAGTCSAVAPPGTSE